MNKSNHKTKSKFNLSRKVKSLQELANRNNENKAITKIIIIATVLFSTLILVIGYYFAPNPTCYKQKIQILKAQEKLFQQKINQISKEIGIDKYPKEELIMGADNTQECYSKHSMKSGIKKLKDYGSGSARFKIKEGDYEKVEATIGRYML